MFHLKLSKSQEGTDILCNHFDQLLKENLYFFLKYSRPFPSGDFMDGDGDYHVHDGVSA